MLSKEGGHFLEDRVRKIKEKAYYFKGFGFHYVSALTNENETIKGGSLYLFGKQSPTIAVSNGYWTGNNGKPYKFKFKDRKLFMGKVAIGF